MKKLLLFTFISLSIACSKDNGIDSVSDGFTVNDLNVKMSKQIARIGDKIEGKILFDINKDPNEGLLYSIEIKNGSNTTSIDDLGAFTIILQSSDLEINLKNKINNKIIFSKDTTIKVYDDLGIDKLFDIIKPSDLKNSQFIRINDPEVENEISNYQSMVDNKICTFDGLFATKTYLYGTTRLDSVIVNHGNLDSDPTISIYRIKSDVINNYGGSVDVNKSNGTKIYINLILRKHT